MKNNKIIIYDDSCPLCAAYTSGFVKAGMIKKENRKSFTTISNDLLNMIDTTRCGNEIPVIDIETKEVWYGIDAIANVLHTKIPYVKKVIAFKPLKWLLNRFYKLISYNRRVIVATKATMGNFDCSPDFNYRYRFAFMLIFLVFNTAMLLPIHSYILNNSFTNVSFWQLQNTHLLLVLFNIGIALCLEPRAAFEYLGQTNMLALITILLLLPLLFLNKFHLIRYVGINNFCLALLTIFVFREYKRRMNFAGIIQKYPVVVALNILGLLAFLISLVY